MVIMGITSEAARSRVVIISRINIKNKILSLDREQIKTVIGMKPLSRGLFWTKKLRVISRESGLKLALKTSIVRPALADFKVVLLIQGSGDHQGASAVFQGDLKMT